MRSFNEAWALLETLPALTSQTHRHWELIVIDSGSTDGSVEFFRKFHPRHLVQISHSDYNPSRVMNQGMQLASSNLVLFLNADATPQGTDWLSNLVAPLLDPKVAAVFGKQIPRQDCRAVFAHDYERCFGAQRESSRWDHFFSMASSGIRKDVWAQRGFNEQLQYSEDDEFTRWCRAQGYAIVYVPESVVTHSHNYSPAQAWKRSFGEGRTLAAVTDARENESHWGKVFLGWANDARKDLAYCVRSQKLNEWPHALRIRFEQRRGRLAGFRDGWAAYRQSDKRAPVRPPTWAMDFPPS